MARYSPSKDNPTNSAPFFMRLPVEIMCRVFKIACDAGNPFVIGSLGPEPVGEVEVSISQVCCLWRSISLAYPKIWSTFSTRQSIRYDILYSRLEKYLERSQDQPLDLWLTLISHQAQDTTSLLTFLRNVQGHKSRLRCLTLFMNDAAHANDTISELTSVATPLLEFVDIRIQNTSPRSPRQRPQRPSGVFPRLLHIRTDATTLAIHFSSHLSNLNTIEIKYTTGMLSPWSFFLDILRSPSLRKLSISWPTFSAPLTQNRSDFVTAPDLESFSCGDPIIANEIFRAAKFPNLRLLILSGLLLAHMSFPYDSNNYRSDDIIQPDLIPSLRTLALVDCNIRNFTSTCPSFLAHATKSVTHLIITNPLNDQSSNVFNFLLEYPQKNHIWPYLDTITYKGDTEDGDAPAYYLRLMQSRCRANQFCKLRLSLEDAKWFEVEYPDSWETFESQGFFEQIPDPDTNVPRPPKDFTHLGGRYDALFT